MNASPTNEELKWDVRQRLKLLESTLLLSGWVRTQALTDSFGISRAQASKDFALYQRLRPGNLVYNKSRKYYEAGPDFDPLLLSGRASQLLDVLGAMPHGDGPVLALTAQGPAVEVMRPLDRELDLRVFHAISRAACNGTKLRLSYQSMRRPEPVELQLSPHTLVFSGLRWHVRAYSDTHGEYRDFVLARMRGVPEVLEEAGASPAADARWHERVTVVIVPHPGLPAAQQAVIAEDYAMTDGRTEHRLRAALVPYFLSLMRVEPDREHPDPAVQQIVLANREALEPLLWK
ncbi:MAG: WYL domain-containing protein [Halothiobacillaceae bacterium]|nr:WYL domain-containing protein [Halothiobacillaceae bacterium]